MDHDYGRPDLGEKWSRGIEQHGAQTILSQMWPTLAQRNEDEMKKKEIGSKCNYLNALKGNS